MAGMIGGGGPILVISNIVETTDGRFFDTAKATLFEALPPSIAEEMYLTEELHFVLHDLIEDEYRVRSQVDAGYWFYKNGYDKEIVGLNEYVLAALVAKTV